MPGLNRRSMLALCGASLVAACSGIRPYDDFATRNLDVVLSAKDSGFWTKRGVYLDVFEGPQSGPLTYLGTREITADAPSIGLPTGRSLLLVLTFEENVGFGSASSASSIELSMPPLSTSQRWRLEVASTRIGFSHDLTRLR